MYEKDLNCECEPFNSCEGCASKNTGIRNKLYRLDGEWMTSDEIAANLHMGKSKFLRRMREGATIEQLQKQMNN